MEADRKYSASASSSDEDDHRRACRKKTRQYLSASQLALWREVLRQEIEEVSSLARNHTAVLL